ncbi:acetylhydrolase [Streptomyces sp. R302]|uniref:acetylhydrolase n=1 Tax=unclassified Streptomyces TaxID=2593676 RepID=UPI00145CD62C|nr:MULTISPECIES: acetylhydrolase [unclassified Streptomyces]NML48817.1 acetylhydrolase [Streptomyces sp. R301]NML77144.1 acetylhydrolase [Streptomyces sp. R302]
MSTYPPRTHSARTHSPRTPSRRTLLGAAVLGAAASVGLTGFPGFPAQASAQAAARAAARASAGLVPVLPAPTGPHPVGVVRHAFTDPARTDPWDPALGARQVVVGIVYPARSVIGYPRAPQLTPGEAGTFGTLAPLVRGLPAAGVDWAGTLTHAHAGAPPLPGRRPVVLYTPGGGDARTLGTGLAEGLASHGTVVVLVDHPGEASQVELPDGTVRETVLHGPPDPATFRTMVETRVADLRLVLDRLDRPDRLDGLPYAATAFMDLRRTGVYGHSAGGTAAALLAARDPRVRAVANLEGYLDLEPWPGDRPLLLLRTDGFEGAGRIERSWAGLRARRRTLRAANHWVFTDHAAIVPRLHAAGLVPDAVRDGLVGPGDAAASFATVRRELRGFFGRELGGPRGLRGLRR